MAHLKITSLGLGNKLWSPNTKLEEKKNTVSMDCFAEVMLKETLLKIPPKDTCLVDLCLWLMSCLEKNVLSSLWEN